MIDADAATLEAEHVTIRLTLGTPPPESGRESAERLHRILQRLERKEPVNIGV